jgi:hypothetical protein
VGLDDIRILLYVFLPRALLLGGIVGLVYAGARWRAGDPWRLVAAVSLIAIAVVGLPRAILVAVNLNGPHTVALVLSWVVLFLLAVVAFTTPGKKTIQRWVPQRKMRATRRIAVAVLTVLWALIAFFPLGGYRLLPTKWENCFVQGGMASIGGTPCGKLSGEQRSS